MRLDSTTSRNLSNETPDMPQVIINEIIATVLIDREKVTQEEVNALVDKMNKDEQARDSIANHIKHVLSNDITNREDVEIRVGNMAPE